MKTARSIPTQATIEVVRHAFLSGAEQMRRNLYRSAYSPVIYEMKDCSVGIYDSNGDLLGQAPGLPFFLGSLGGTIKSVLEQQGPESFQPNDVWFVNDSAICGSHLNDVTVFQPIFIDAKLRGFSGAKAHWNDVGGKEAGYISDSTNIFQEGLRIPPMRLVTDGVLDQQLLELVMLNSRFPSSLAGDLKAEITACHTGVERCSYHAEGWLDGDGVSDRPVKVVVTVRIKDDHMTVDLTGSNPECEGSINSGIVQTRSAIQQAFKFLVNPNAPVCGGNFRNLKIVVPKGSCFDPSPTAACLHYGPHLMLAMDLMVRAISDVAPDRAAAGHVGDSWNVSIVNERGHTPFVSGESLVGGWGAYPGGDGESALIHSAAGDFKNFPVETMEHRFPLRIQRHSLREGSGGDGEWRGGLGIVRIYELLEDARINLWFERSKTPSWGIGGGHAGAAPDVWVHIPGSESQRILKVNALPVSAGTRIDVFTGGGGGWGDPTSRSDIARREDERVGLVPRNSSPSVEATIRRPKGSTKGVRA